MKHVIKLIAISSLLVLVAIASAQGGGGGGGRGQGRGFGRGMNNSPTGVLNRADVQAEIKLTDEQKKKLQELRDKQQQEMRDMFQNAGGGMDRTEMQKMMQERQAKTDKETNAILTPEQQKRLYEVWIQIAGNRALLNDTVQKDLKLSDDQKKKIKDLQTKQQEAMQALMEKVRNQEIDRSQVQEINKKNDDAMNVELGKILTTDQAAKFKEMGGKPFKQTDPAPGGGRGGGGGG